MRRTEPYVQDVRLIAYRNHGRRADEIYLTALDGDRGPVHGEISWVSHNSDEDPGPSLVLTDVRAPGWAQSLMNDLWAMGIRPNDLPADTPALVAAKEQHIVSLERILATVLPAGLRKPS